MLLTVPQGLEAKAMLAAGGKGVRLVVQLIEMPRNNTEGGTDLDRDGGATEGEKKMGVATCKLQQLAVLAMWAFCDGGSECRQLALRVGLVHALIECMRVEVNAQASERGDPESLALRYEAARL